MPEQSIRADRRWFPGTACLAALMALALGALALGGCASMKQSRAEDAQFTSLQKLLPGRYDNASQVSADARAGAPGAHAAPDACVLCGGTRRTYLFVVGALMMVVLPVLPKAVAPSSRWRELRSPSTPGRS